MLLGWWWWCSLELIAESRRPETVWEENKKQTDANHQHRNNSQDQTQALKLRVQAVLDLTLAHHAEPLLPVWKNLRTPPRDRLRRIARNGRKSPHLHVSLSSLAGRPLPDQVVTKMLRACAGRYV